MKKIYFLIFLLVLIIAAVVYFIFTKSEKQNTCDIECPPTKITCPDGSMSTCNSVCDPISKGCINCIPDCAGHETPKNMSENTSEIILCPDISPSENFCKDGRIVPIYDDIGCVKNYECAR